MPEVPEQIQENLAHLELEANGPRQRQSSQHEYPSSMAQYPSRQDSAQHQQYEGNQNQGNGYNRSSQGGYQREEDIVKQYNGYGQSNQSQSYGQQQYQNPAPAPTPAPVAGPGPASQTYKSYEYAGDTLDPFDQPSFSPFPRLRNPPANVPPSDDEKEATLEAARVKVLNSNDPEVQLAWAQDALAYVGISMQNEIRVSQTQSSRPQTPQVEHQLRVDAISIVSFLAEQHHPKAEFMRGLWLEFGKFGFRTDKKEAFRCYVRAAEKGYARAEYRIGMSWESSDEFLKAKQHYQNGARQGDSASNYRLGMMALLGQHGERQDFGRGVQLIRLSAQSADENAPQGAYVFGMLQARELPNINIPELFLPLDINAARVNLEKAAYLGFAKAQVKMGQAYELCQLGCDFNPALSLHYNALAARQGEAEADMAISKWFLCGYDGVFEKNEELAYTYAQRAAQDKLSTAEFAMGYFHEIGMYVPVDLKEARVWYERAAEHGNKDAAGRIESIRKDKTLSKNDHEKIAISRIKSQYGSMKGKRPERLTKSAAPPMPSIQDEEPPLPVPPPRSGKTPVPQATAPAVEFPDPTKTVLLPYGNTQVPARPASAVPYPTEDGPPRAGAHSNPSPAGFLNPNLMPQPIVRPSSAFGINPNLRAQPAGPADNAPYPGGPTRPYSTIDANSYSGGPAYPGGPARPRSSIDNRPMGGTPKPLSDYDSSRGGRGRGGMGPGGAGPRGRGRVGSGGIPSDYRAPSRQEDYEYRSPDPRGRGKPPPDAAKAQPPKLDIGFSAPPEAARNKLTKPGPNTGKAQPSLPDIGFSAPEDRRPAKTPTIPASTDHQDRRDDRRASGSRPGSHPASPISSRPPRHESLPAPTNRPPPTTNQQIPQGSSKPPKPAHANTTPAPKPTPAVPAEPRPPGKGPKTFDDMGIENAPKENECVSTLTAKTSYCATNVERRL